MFKTWEELTPLEQAHCTYSDMYKDAYGFRPRHDVSDWTLEDFATEFDILSDTIAENDRQEEIHQEANIVEFEGRVQQVIDSGAKDRETAIRWLRESVCETVGDDDRLCYMLGLPYGYFRK